MAGMDLGVVLAERAVADVVQNIFDLPVASDPVREQGTGECRCPVGNLTLGQDVAAVVHRGEQGDVRGGGGA
ncbi:hypothetical protein ACFYP4_09165 [Streptomyces sp. NPDC005551]|uniref:hypothetical protein n=1 Tax=unclassified Streptomyces TaxID=2593676 RepID=UPI0033EFEDE5